MRTHLVLVAAALVAGCATSNAPTSSAPAVAAAPAVAPAAAPAPAAAAKPAANSPESQARKLGYRVVERDGKQFFCKEVAEIGTRFKDTVCITPDQFKTVQEQSQRDKDNIRRNAGKCNTPSGVCGG